MEKPGHVEIGVGDRLKVHYGDAIVTAVSTPPRVAKIIEHAGREVLHPLSGSSIMHEEHVLKSRETWPPEKVSQGLIDGHEAVGLPSRTEEQQEELHKYIRDNHAQGKIQIRGEYHS